MRCEELLAMLNEYVDGTIGPAFCEDFEKHLVGCNPCRIIVHVRPCPIILRLTVKRQTPARRPLAVLTLLLVAIGFAQSQETPGRKPMDVPDDFPRFVVPGREPQMRSLREL